VNLNWHGFLQFKSGWEDIVDGEETKRQAEVRQEPDIFMRWKKIREIDLDQGLRELQGPEARFREIQRGSEDGIKDDCSRDQEGDGDHGNRQGEEFSVHVTSQGKQRWVDNCYCSI